MKLRYGEFSAGVNRRGVIAALLGSFMGLQTAQAQTGAGQPVRIAMLGDSLTAGYGLRAEESLPNQLEKRLKESGLPVTIINHGVSGDTSEGGLQRLDWMLGDRPDIVIVALGGNDALRGLDPKQTERNLDQILARLRADGVPVVLAGMLAPRNFGSTYAQAFDGLYPRLAEKHGAILYPFLLDGVAMDQALNQPDGIHPNARGASAIAERLAPAVKRAIEQWSAAGRRPRAG
jgi:acyl-CoA thioesterase-1